MNKFEVFFKNGNFIDVKTNRVVHFKPMEKLFVESNAYSLGDDIGGSYKVLNSEEKFLQLTDGFKDYKLHKLFDAKTTFVFRVGLGKNSTKDKSTFGGKEFFFKAVIKEDLYMKYRLSEHENTYYETLKLKNTRKWSLCPCVCEAVELLEGNLGFAFHKIEGDTLNNLFSNVISSYFNMKRSTAGNAFKDFRIYENGMKGYSIDEIRNKIDKSM